MTDDLLVLYLWVQLRLSIIVQIVGVLIMSNQQISPVILLWAQGTFMRSNLLVASSVINKIATRTETSLANFTMIRFLSTVSPHVNPEVPIFVKNFAASGMSTDKSEWNSSMTILQMNLESIHPSELFVTLRALESISCWEVVVGTFDLLWLVGMLGLSLALGIAKILLKNKS